MKNIFAVFLLFSLNSFAQKQEVFRIDSLPKQGILLDKNWKWHAGDNPDFAKADFDDSAWESIDPTKDIFDLPQVRQAEIGYLSNAFWIDSTLVGKPIALTIRQSIASEIFLNGKSIYRLGVVSSNEDIEQIFITNGHPYSIVFNHAGFQRLSVRASFTKHNFLLQFRPVRYPFFEAKISKMDETLNEHISNFTLYAFLDYYKVGILLFLALLHLFLFVSLPEQKANLYIFFYAICQLFPFFADVSITQLPLTGIESNLLNHWSIFFLVLGAVFSLLIVYNFLKTPKGFWFWAMLFLIVLGYPLSYFSSTFGPIYISIVLGGILAFESIRISLKTNRFESKYIIIGWMLYILFMLVFYLFVFRILPFSNTLINLFANLGLMSIPICYSLILVNDYVRKNSSLQQKLMEVENLSAEKQQILATQNETLEKQVAERTAELVHKNRDLEIEGALEKIRSTSLAMYHSDEIESVVSVLFEKLKELGLVFDGGAAIHVFSEGSKDAAIWVVSPQQPPTKINLPYDEVAFIDNPIIQDVWHAKETGINIFNKIYSFEEKNKYFLYVFKHNDYTKIPEMGRNFILNVPNYTASFVAEKNSLLGANSWTGQIFSETDFEVLKRVAKVFEQAYVRFLDLQKAEAQAREAQIEAALEKIRSKSLAMHHSGELKDVIAVMSEKLKELNVLIDSVSIQLFDEKTQNSFFWLGSDLNDNPRMIYLPYDETIFNEDTYLKDSWQAKNTGNSIINKKYSFEQKNRYFDYVFNNNDWAVIPQPIRDFIMQAPTHTTCLFIEKNSSLFVDSWTERLYSAEQIEVLKRVAKVFEQAYIRFLDLQKAETQAREAQIEVALERVRSKTMAMQHSNELQEAANVLSHEVRALGIPIWSCGYNIIEKNEKVCIGWMSTEGAIQPSFRIPLEVSPTFIRFYESRQKGEMLYEEQIGGADLEKHYNYMMTLPEFAPSLNNFINSGHQLPTFQVNTVVNFAHGNLIFISAEPVPEAYEIFKRFTTVFEQTYTRFLDLQKAEAQSEQAKLDLILIQTEKKRAEDALVELRATQTQLIQKEKLASLGELTAGIAHEIQNPLNFVNNFSELSVDLAKDLSEEIDKEIIDKEYVKELMGDLTQNQEKINHHGKRASSIVKGMLEHSRASTGIKELTDINALADEYLRLSYHGLRAKDNSFNADFKTDFDENLPKVEVIPQDFGRVLLNLFNNAFYAVKGGVNPVVQISTKVTDNQVVIKVQDNGTGMSEGTKAKIFQPFFTTKPTGQGTGLGLSLAYDIVTKGHSGTIDVESMEGGGTTFTIKLPIQNA